MHINYKLIEKERRVKSREKEKLGRKKRKKSSLKIKRGV